MEYEAIIGLEVHIQLNTKTKAFCGCPVNFGAPPNTQICPVCLGLPGSLPVLNKRALEFAVRVSLALNCDISRFTKFDRKNYFYPDLPKNFQISQYDLPLASGGFLNIETSNTDLKSIRIRRIHLEEDAGKLIHTKDFTLIDYNRAGIPLLEIVTEPDINSPQEAYIYLQQLKLLVQYLGVSDCDMEKGSLRCDANISLRRKGSSCLGTKVELKNMNSFKAIKDALTYEYQRQQQELEKGNSIIQESRLWSLKDSKTIPMRQKEEVQDYRYFPEPDLVPFLLEESFIEDIKNTLPELPQQRLSRFIKEYSLSKKEAQILISDKLLADFFEDCANLYPKRKSLYNWIVDIVLAEVNTRKKSIVELGLSPKSLINLIDFVEKGKISRLRAKDVLREMLDTLKDPLEIIKEKDMFQIVDKKILFPILEEVLNEHKKSVEDYLKGKKNALMFLIGQVMKKTKGRADPKVVAEVLKDRLDKEEKK